MQLVEQHIIRENDSRFEAIDKVAFASKNLYNAANYVLRHQFIFYGRYISYPELVKQIKKKEVYQALPAKVAQQVLINLDKNWQSFFAASQEYKSNPEKFTNIPKIPNYKEKQKGRNIIVYTNQAISRVQLKQGKIKPSGLDISIQTKQSHVDCVRIVPKKIHYVVEVVYTVQPSHAKVDASLVASLDIGLNTSKCSFLDNEPIGKHEVYVGKRISRGMFRSSSGKLINADVNGAYNILRKVAPNAFPLTKGGRGLCNGVEGVVVHPLRVSLKNKLCG